MNLKNILKPEYCVVLASNTKTEALIELIDLVAGAEGVDDIENLKKEVFFREQLMSTGIGQGIGVPHVRYEGVTKPIVAIGVKPEGLSDYESMDSEPVSLIFLFIVGKEQHREYLRLLSLVSSKIKAEEFREKLLHASTGEEICSLLTGEQE